LKGVANVIVLKVKKKLSQKRQGLSGGEGGSVARKLKQKKTPDGMKEGNAVETVSWSQNGGGDSEGVVRKNVEHREGLYKELFAEA